MTLAERLRAATGALADAAIPNPRREARLLLGHATGLDPAALLRLMDTEIPAPGFDAAIRRRLAHEPMAFILGRQPFWTFSVAVSPDTLIPRADSEALIDAALLACAGQPVHRVLDLGTGTGCLLLAALLEFSTAWGVGVDRVAQATVLARQNAASVGLADRSAFVCADWAAPLAGRFDLVLCNPPYIRTADLAGLMPDVADFEPASALDGGADGLAAYRAVLRALPAVLTQRGAAILELGAGQASEVSALAAEAGLIVHPAQPDLAGIARALPLRVAGG